MMKNVIMLGVVFISLQAGAQQPEHGTVKLSPQGQVLTWQQSNQTWLSIDMFWLNFAQSNNAKYWVSSDTYPAYNDVQEFDTFLVKVKQGTCLMQFFHGRWRRANDVQRWDDAFNDYSGCPYVFD